MGILGEAFGAGHREFVSKDPLGLRPESMSLKQPIGQKRLTNIAVVRLKKGGKRFEVACYKNKVTAWRDGVETDADEVLQGRTVYLNVGKGQVASANDLESAFGTSDADEVALVILSHGMFQESEGEREAAAQRLARDVAQTVCERTVNPGTNRPYPVGVIERAMASMGFALKPNRGAKQQALDVIRALVEGGTFPISRAKMKVALEMECGAVEAGVNKRIVEEWGGAVERRETLERGGVRLIAVVDPESFRAMDAALRGVGGSVEVLRVASTEEGEKKMEGWGEATDATQKGGSKDGFSEFDDEPDADRSNAAAHSMAELTVGAAGRGGNVGDGSGVGYGSLRVSMPKPRQGFAGGGGGNNGQIGSNNISSQGVVGEGAAPSTKLSCKTCLNVQFDTATEHREHFRGTWHSRNLKYKSQGVQPVSMEEHRFMEMEEQGHLGGSLSASAALGGKGKKGKRGKGISDGFEAEFQ